MALFSCGECGKQISDKAAACPHCGCPVSQFNTSNREEVIAAERAMKEKQEQERLVTEKAKLNQQLQRLLDNIETGDYQTIKYEIQISRDLIVSVMDGVNSYSERGDSGVGWYDSFIDFFNQIDKFEDDISTWSAMGKDTSSAEGTLEQQKEKIRDLILHWMRIGRDYFTGKRKR